MKADAVPGKNPGDWEAAMRRGDWQAAWDISDIVLAARDPRARDDPSLPYHLRWVWDGSDPRGRHVLVRCYHGLGDTLQFVRYLHPLRKLVASLALEVQPELLPLLAEVAGADRLIPFRQDAPAPPAECDIEIMELAHVLRLPPDPRTMPYLTARADRVAAARRRVGSGAIGVCWQAGGWDTARSIPWPLLASHLAATGRPLVSLQAACTTPDILDTAALIAAVACVVTVDTMVAHLAGALGVPTWLLLKARADWRWQDNRGDTPWYPATRLCRQQSPGEWLGALEEIKLEASASFE